MVNNWYIVTDACIRVSETKFAAAFFVSFFVITNMVVLNILMALILDCSATMREEQGRGESFVSNTQSHQSHISGSSLNNAQNDHGAMLLRRVLLEEGEVTVEPSSPHYRNYAASYRSASCSPPHREN